MQQLVEGMLGVCGRLAEEDGTCCVFDIVAVTSDGLAIGLHGELLEVGREAVEVLVESVKGS